MTAMKIKLSPPQVLLIGFLSVIVTGALLLMLPFAHVGECSFIDVLFTSTSAVCVTGLIVKDIPNDFTLFGYIVILMLIQMGGLGYMTSATIIFLAAGKRIGITERLTMKEGLNIETLEGVVKFTKSILLFTTLFELVGTLVLTARFLMDYPAADAFLYGLFHAVSAFNNAGFSLFSDNLMRYRGDITVNLTITTLIIAGGIGFMVTMDLYKFLKKEVDRLTQHSKIVLLTTAGLIVMGAVMIFLNEYANPRTLGIMPLKEKILVSYFSSVTARTAGFNTVDYSLLKTETLFLTITLMFIGASPGSTGGGVKTSTVAVILASLYTTMRSRIDTVLFRRRVPTETVAKAFLLMVLAVMFCTVSSHFIITTQDTLYFPSAFEVTSAFGTVGLSMGDSGVRSFAALFTPIGKFIIILTMFVGRLGPLSLAVAMTRQAKERFRHPEGKVILG